MSLLNLTEVFRRPIEGFMGLGNAALLPGPSPPPPTFPSGWALAFDEEGASLPSWLSEGPLLCRGSAVATGA